MVTKQPVITFPPTAVVEHTIAPASAVVPSMTMTMPPTLTPPATATLTVTPLPSDPGCIVFTSTGTETPDEMHWQIYKLDVNDSVTQYVHTVDAPNEFWTHEPSLSPDGEFLVFVEIDPRGTDIYKFHLESEELIHLTSGMHGEDEYSGTYANPAWSPDSSQIAYAYNPHFYRPYGEERLGYELYVMNTDGSGVVSLTDDNLADEMPVWSPDGKKILFSRGEWSDWYQAIKYDLYTINPDGTNLTQITHTANMSELYPAWSPDGSKIAFSAFVSGNTDVYVINADGSNLTRLTHHTADDLQPDWSPDGTRIVFVSARDDMEWFDEDYRPWPGELPSYQLYVMNADGSDQHNITQDKAYNADPDWGVCAERP